MTYILKNQWYSNRLIKMFMRISVFPFEYSKTEDILQEISLPSKDMFYSTLSSSHIRDEDCKHARIVL